MGFAGSIQPYRGRLSITRKVDSLYTISLHSTITGQSRRFQPVKKRVLVLAVICSLGFWGADSPVRGRIVDNEISRQASGFVLPILKRDSLLNGLDLIVLEQRGTGSVAVRLRINSGGLFDLATKGGLADLTAGMLLKGGGGLTESDIQEIVEESGLRVSITAGWDSTDVTVSGPADRLDTIFDLIGRLVITPAFDQKELASLKASRIAAFKSEALENGLVVERKALEAVYGSHPYGRPLRGAEESIGRISRADLSYYHGRFYIANNSDLIVTGDATAEEVTRLARARLGAWKKGDKVPATFRPPDALQSRRLMMIDRKEGVEAHVTIAHTGISRRASDYFAATVMGEILAESVSKLEGSGAGKAVATRIDARYLPGPIVINLRAAPEEVVAKIEGVIAAMSSLQSAPAAPDQVEAAKGRVINTISERLRSTDAAADVILDIELYGLGRDYLVTFLDRVKAIAPTDVMKAAQSYLKPAALVIVVAGPAERIETSLKRLGAVTALP
jgi:zinc protease